MDEDAFQEAAEHDDGSHVGAVGVAGSGLVQAMLEEPGHCLVADQIDHGCSELDRALAARMSERGVAGDQAGSTPGVLQACALVDEEGVDGGDDGRELVRFVEVLARVGEPEQDFFQLRGILSALGESGKGPLPAVLAVVLRHPLPAGVLQEASDLVTLAVIEVLVAADDAGQFLQGVGIQDAEWGLRSHAGPSVLVPLVSSSSVMSVAATGSVVSGLSGASAEFSASPSSEERSSGVH